MRIARCLFVGLSKRRQPETVATAIIIAGAVFASTVSDSLVPLLVVVAVKAAIALFVRPRLVVILLIIAWAGPFDPEMLYRAVGGLRLTFGFVLLTIGLAWLLASRGLKRKPPGEASFFYFAKPIAFYFIVLLTSLSRAYAAGEMRGFIINIAFACTAVLAYFIAHDAYAGDPDSFARHLVIVTGVCSLVVVVGVVTGIDWLYGRQIGYVITEGQATQAIRIDPPLLRMLSVTILMIGPGRVLASGALRSFRWPLIGFMILAEALSLTRSTWTPLLLAAVLIPVIAARRGRIVVLSRNIAVAMLILGLGLGAASSGLLGQQGLTTAERFRSTTGSSVTQDGSYQDRVKENEAALAMIAEHPILGIGLPRPYGVYQLVGPDSIDPRFNRYLPQQYIHESYLGLWMWMGAPGVLALVWLIALLVKIAHRINSDEKQSRTAPIACLAGVLVLGIGSTFQTNLMYPPAHLALGLSLAFLEIWTKSGSVSANTQACVPTDPAIVRRTGSRSAVLSRSPAITTRPPL